jgi:ElaA protein
MTTTVKTFRELSAQEFFRICEVREQVFVLEQKITLCAELDEQDLHSTHITVTEDDKIVAYARCYAEDGSAHIGRVLTTVRGKSYGLEVMKTAIAHCRKVLGCSHIVVHAQVQVIGFYEKLGFRVTSDLFDECGILHKTMELE